LSFTQDTDKKIIHITLNLGLADGNYSYKITAVAHKDGYNDKSVEKTVNFSIDKANFNNFTITYSIPSSVDGGYADSQI
jgi:hypothetical protein